MSREVALGVDIGTSGGKGVLVDRDGQVLAVATRAHEVSRPRPGWAEMDGDLWWDEFVAISRDLLAQQPARVVCVGVSGMGPCVLLTDEHDRPVRPAILYGVDTRATDQIDALHAALGADEILRVGGCVLTSQATGPKIRWVAETEPDRYARARRLYMPSSWLGHKLTGGYALDHTSASMCTPLYDRTARDWYRPWCEMVAPGLDLPPLRWPGERLGQVSAGAAAATGIPAGTPVAVGTIDAWSEAISAGACRTGDLMLMYGTTMFLINVVGAPGGHPALWATAGTTPGTHCLAAGLATSGAITTWLRDLYGGPDWTDLFTAARRSPAGAHGLLTLPYFAGERTPIMDPHARGVLAGLALTHTRGDIFRSALEATGFAVRHNVATLTGAGGVIRRVVAVGGGTTDPLWTRIVSDITGLDQQIPAQTIGACYGAAYLAARLRADVDIDTWNPIVDVRHPDPAPSAVYAELYERYLHLYTETRTTVHALATLDRRHGARPSGAAP